MTSGVGKPDPKQLKLTFFPLETVTLPEMNVTLAGTAICQEEELFFSIHRHSLNVVKKLITNTLCDRYICIYQSCQSMSAISFKNLIANGKNMMFFVPALSAYLVHWLSVET